MFYAHFEFFDVILNTCCSLVVIFQSMVSWSLKTALTAACRQVAAAAALREGVRGPGGRAARVPERTPGLLRPAAP